MTLSRSEDFFQEFKRATEAKWSIHSISRGLYGFQFQRGTRWNPGLSEKTISEYQDILGMRFPHDFKAFLRVMNGTDLPTLNVYGSRGEPPRQSVGVYSYPRDIELILKRVKDVRKTRAEVVADLAKQGFDLPDEAGLVPIYMHRYVMCTANLKNSVVLSIDTGSRKAAGGGYEPAADAIVYGDSLKEYLEREFLMDADTVGV